MGISFKSFRKLAALACVVLGAAALAGCSRDDLPATSFNFASSPGEYIGQGVNASYAAPNFTVTVTGTTADLIMRVSGGSESWTARIAAPYGQTLHVGTFLNAERASFRSGTAPGLDIYGDGRGCNTLTGQFTIYQLRTDAAGNIVQLDADATQHCEGGATTLLAALRVNARPMDLSLTSDKGDYVGQGIGKTYFGDTSTFNLQAYGSSGINYSASGQGDFWQAIITPPTGTQLTKGVTYQTTRFADATHAGLDFFGDGRGCNMSTGSLTVTDIRRDAAGNVTAVNASFVQHCEGATPALHGTIRYNA